MIIGGSYGAGNYGMCGRAFDPRFLLMWPNARISVMGGEQAATVLATVRATASRATAATWAEREEAAFKPPVIDQSEYQGDPLYATARPVGRRHDRPGETREVLALCLSAALHAADRRRRRFGVFRM